MLAHTHWQKTQLLPDMVGFAPSGMGVREEQKQVGVKGAVIGRSAALCILSSFQAQSAKTGILHVDWHQAHGSCRSE